MLSPTHKPFTQEEQDNNTDTIATRLHTIG